MNQLTNFPIFQQFALETIRKLPTCYCACVLEPHAMHPCNEQRFTITNIKDVEKTLGFTPLQVYKIIDVGETFDGKILILFRRARWESKKWVATATNELCDTNTSATQQASLRRIEVTGMVWKLKKMLASISKQSPFFVSDQTFTNTSNFILRSDRCAL